MNTEKIIIIGGGVGPQAGVLLHKYIIENTLTDGIDQNHLDIYHISRSSHISDRTEALEKGTVERPAFGMYETFKIAESSIDISKSKAVGGIPCNTFHALEIFKKFEKLMNEFNSKIKIVNMIEETILEVIKTHSDVKKIGLLSTDGTRKAGIYSLPLQEKTFEIIQIPEESQSKLHHTIYNNKWGIKAVTPVSKKAKINIEEFSDYLIDKGAEIILLGCTEIPLAIPNKDYRDIPIIDPMVSLARALIREANIDKLKRV